MKEQLRLWSRSIIETLITAYVILLFMIYPLYYQDRYVNMGDAKYSFVKYVSIVIIVGVLFMGVLHLFTQSWKGIKVREWIASHISITDWFVIAYGCVVILSYIHTPYKDVAFWGYEGWYMGLMSQLLFVLIYFGVSRYGSYNSTMAYGILVTASITHILAILQRFTIDPLGLYEGMLKIYYPSFLTTMGNINWYSSYLCIVFPLATVWYLLEQTKWRRCLLALYIMIGAASLVTQNSDSAFFALFFLSVFLLLVSLRQKSYLLKVLEIFMFIGSAFMGIGILQIIYSHRVIPLSGLSIFCSQSLVTKVVVMVIVVCYIAIKYWLVEGSLLKGDIFCYNITKIRVIILASLMVIILTVLGVMFLVTHEQLPQNLSFLQEIGYLNFNDEWGTDRGFIWNVSVRMWNDYSISYKLLGCGPDAFAQYAYEDYYVEIIQIWDDGILTNAHNEWLHTMLVTGILGLFSYLGIFLIQIVRGCKYMEAQPILMCGVACIISYMTHNTFCYQQIISTPLIFIVLGLMEGKIVETVLDNNKT